MVGNTTVMIRLPM